MSDTRAVLAVFRPIGERGSVPSIGSSLPDPLPVLPQPRVEEMVVKVDGSGSVTGVPGERTLSGSRGLQRINCGVSGGTVTASTGSAKSSR
jgi:hypothetical protein